ncbi:hypothetical protein [Desulfotomaculum sp. 1211_IL3151]
MVRKNKKQQELVVAAGMSDFLEKSAAPEQIEKGEFTKVTRLSYDETH